MSFLKKLAQLSKPVVLERKFDFGLGDGEETLYFRRLNHIERTNIIGKRIKEDGTLRQDISIAAELVAACLCSEDGSQLTNIGTVQKWPPDIVDALGALALDVINTSQAEAKAEDPAKG